MPAGKGKKYSAKQDRQAEHVADGYKKKGVSKKKATSIGYAVVNSRKKKKQ